MFSQYSLADSVLDKLRKVGFVSPTAVQSACLPSCVGGKDILVASKTGTGKTLIYALPIVSRLINKNTGTALIVVPTRELAAQVRSQFEQIMPSPAAVRIGMLVGGMSMQKQQRMIRSNLHVIIGTPGRIQSVFGCLFATMRKEADKLIDRENAGDRKIEGKQEDSEKTKSCLLDFLYGLDSLVLDEADRLVLDSGHFRELTAVLKGIYQLLDTQEARTGSQLQTFVLSATLPLKDLKPLMDKVRLRSAERRLVVDMTESDQSRSLSDLSRHSSSSADTSKVLAGQVPRLPDTLKFAVCYYSSKVNRNEGEICLMHSLLGEIRQRSSGSRSEPFSAAVFVNSVSYVPRLTSLLRLLFASHAAARRVHIRGLHSKMKQNRRLNVLDLFSKKEGQVDSNPSEGEKPVRILVCTDIAARGIDFTNLDLVVHLHAPRSAEDFTHRCGRTARIGKSGACLIMVDSVDPSQWNKIETSLSIRVSELPTASTLSRDSRSALVRVHDLLSQIDLMVKSNRRSAERKARSKADCEGIDAESESEAVDTDSDDESVIDFNTHPAKRKRDSAEKTKRRRAVVSELQSRLRSLVSTLY